MDKRTIDELHNHSGKKLQSALQEHIAARRALYEKVITSLEMKQKELVATKLKLIPIKENIEDTASQVRMRQPESLNSVYTR